MHYFCWHIIGNIDIHVARYNYIDLDYIHTSILDCCWSTFATHWSIGMQLWQRKQLYTLMVHGSRIKCQCYIYVDALSDFWAHFFSETVNSVIWGNFIDTLVYVQGLKISGYNNCTHAEDTIIQSIHENQKASITCEIFTLITDCHIVVQKLTSLTSTGSHKNEPKIQYIYVIGQQ